MIVCVERTHKNLVMSVRGIRMHTHIYPQPVAVQIGNEVTVGMLWSPQGQPCDHGGYLGYGPDGNW